MDMSSDAGVTSGKGCTTLQLFPYAVFDDCTIYTRVTLTTTQITCETCVNTATNPPKYCKPQDDCDAGQPLANLGPGVKVDVDGTPNCALSGFIDNCDVYVSMDGNKLLGGCKTCVSGFSLGTSVTNAQICLPAADSVTNCTKYYYPTASLNKYKCALCLSGLPYNSVNDTCPKTASELIPGCQTAIVTNTNTVICTSCSLGYVLDSNSYGSRCIQAITYCSTYRSIVPPICSVCISGYVLNNNTCSKQSAQCATLDSNGKCVECIAGFTIVNGLCVQYKTCTPTQYVNSLGNCQEGNVANCGSYSSPNGECTGCMTGFAFNTKLECAASSITCPSATSATKFIVMGTTCVETDINCQNVRSDGYCSICNTGYYQSAGKCFLIAQTQDESVRNVDEFSDLLTDQFGYQYMLNKDGSRSYVTGPWIGL